MFYTDYKQRIDWVCGAFKILTSVLFLFNSRNQQGTKNKVCMVGGCDLGFMSAMYTDDCVY